MTMSHKPAIEGKRNRRRSGGRTFHINLVGDVMLGRLIDQLFPEHVNNLEDARVISTFKRRNPELNHYSPRHPWGSTLPLFESADLNLINLETAVTTISEPWPDKAFNYRMHPANLASIMKEAHIDYANLANNHTLDFGTEGLMETAWTLMRARVGFSGAGETSDQARAACLLSMPRNPRGVFHGGQIKDPTTTISATAISSSTSTSASGPKGTDTEPSPDTKGEEGDDTKNIRHAIQVYSASDHPSDWAEVPTFHLIDYSTATKDRLRSLLTKPHPSHTSTVPSLRIFSVHWGPNYAWRPSAEIRDMAHFLVDECGVDIVHGHSSHHVQGVEGYHGKLIVYGCGDFVDDYALNEHFRNDLGAVWRVSLVEDCDQQEEKEKEEAKEQDKKGEDEEEGRHGRPSLRLDKLEVFPTRIHRFQANLLTPEDPDHRWVREKIVALSKELRTQANSEVGEAGQLIIDLG